MRHATRKTRTHSATGVCRSKISSGIQTSANGCAKTACFCTGRGIHFGSGRNATFSRTVIECAACGTHCGNGSIGCRAGTLRQTNAAGHLTSQCRRSTACAAHSTGTAHSADTAHSTGTACTTGTATAAGTCARRVGIWRGARDWHCTEREEESQERVFRESMEVDHDASWSSHRLRVKNSAKFVSEMSLVSSGSHTHEATARKHSNRGIIRFLYFSDDAPHVWRSPRA